MKNRAYRDVARAPSLGERVHDAQKLPGAKEERCSEDDEKHQPVENEEVAKRGNRLRYETERKKGCEHTESTLSPVARQR